MLLKKIIAIIDELQLPVVEKALSDHGITGFTVHPVKGRGHYANLFSEDGLVNHQQIEVYTSDQYAEKIAELIVDTACLDGAGQGIVAINTVDKLYGVSDKKAINPNDFNFFE